MSAAPAIATEFGFEIAMVRIEVAPGAMLAGVKAFTAVGPWSTFSVALALAAVPALVVVTGPVALRYALALALVTLTVIVQEPLAGTVPALSARLVPLFAAVTAPAPHVVAPDAEAVFTRPAGYVSVKAAPVTAAAFGFVSVTVRTLVPLMPITAGVKDFATVRLERTVSVALAGAELEPALVDVTPPAGMVFG